ncbi:DnaD domain protein [Chloroflexi bacterium CFX6]|nr:DnaD domain protein [Chloroflexi bacterium CFX6]
MTGFKQPNFTQVPNELFEMMPTMSDNELRVVLALLRQTSGYGRDKAEMSIPRIRAMTGLSRNSVTKGAGEAEKRGVVKRLNPDEKRSAKWQIKWEKTPSRREGVTAEHPHPVRVRPSPGEGQVGLKKELNKKDSSSSETEPILLFYKQEFGKVAPTIEEKLLTAKETYSEEWVLEALTEAVTYNKPSWAYAETILKRWKQEGKTKTKGVRHDNRQAGSSTGKRSNQNPPTEPTPADLEAARRAMAKRKLNPNQKRL